MLKLHSNLIRFHAPDRWSFVGFNNRVTEQQHLTYLEVYFKNTDGALVESFKVMIVARCYYFNDKIYA